MAKILCPYCEEVLEKSEKTTDGFHCPGCDREMSRKYVMKNR